MESLATLGSDKSVTTINAILTEIFTGIKPKRIIIYREDPPAREIKDGLEKALNYVNVDTSVEPIIVGYGIDKWRSTLSNADIDVFDVTPGRKYMALSASSYSKAKQIRYVYLKKESEGYRIFGYVPFNMIEVLDIRSGDKIDFDPPLTKESDNVESTLGIDELRAFINILSLHGIKLDLDYLGLEDNEICLTRAGIVKYEEEKYIESEVKNESLFLADTNIYISLGSRLAELIPRYRLLSSRNTYNELKNRSSNTTQKSDENLIKFTLGLQAYQYLHPTPPITSQVSTSGDIGLIDEAVKLKSNINNKVVLLTADQGVAIAAQNKGLNVIYLEKKIKAKDVNCDNLDVNCGELIQCLSYFRKRITIPFDNKGVAEISPDYSNIHKRNSKVKVLNKKYNFAKMLEILSRTISGKL
ncbi:hypothetical protein V6M85_07375 [Sulfolobus tengchongensis]|uniref:PIN domain-containing protein n=1 Tax=Sulfolobus tengchongensis TaxID=207809 RepID=A0AAX4KXJ1_9CREN